MPTAQRAIMLLALDHPHAPNALLARSQTPPQPPTALCVPQAPLPMPQQPPTALCAGQALMRKTKAPQYVLHAPQAHLQMPLLPHCARPVLLALSLICQAPLSALLVQWVLCLKPKLQHAPHARPAPFLAMPLPPLARYVQLPPFPMFLEPPHACLVGLARMQEQAYHNALRVLPAHFHLWRGVLLHVKYVLPTRMLQSEDLWCAPTAVRGSLPRQAL